MLPATIETPAIPSDLRECPVSCLVGFQWNICVRKFVSFLKAGPRLLMRKTGLYPVYYLRRYGYLREQNWYASYNDAEVIGPNGEPYPWLTYAAIHFLESRLTSAMDVFEFGAGNSSLWWSSKVRQVVSVEHSPKWYDYLSPKLPTNSTLLLKSIDSDDYCSAALAQSPNTFDIICIDGRDRVKCALRSVEALNEAGVIVWDNTDRREYEEGYSFLADRGFRKLDFHGMGSRCVEGWTTSIFYRPNNCLGI